MPFPKLIPPAEYFCCEKRLCDLCINVLDSEEAQVIASRPLKLVVLFIEVDARVCKIGAECISESSMFCTESEGVAGDPSFWK